MACLPGANGGQLSRSGSGGRVFPPVCAPCHGARRARWVALRSSRRSDACGDELWFNRYRGGSVLARAAGAVPLTFALAFGRTRHRFKPSRGGRSAARSPAHAVHGRKGGCAAHRNRLLHLWHWRAALSCHANLAKDRPSPRGSPSSTSGCRSRDARRTVQHLAGPGFSTGCVEIRWSSCGLPAVPCPTPVTWRRVTADVVVPLIVGGLTAAILRALSARGAPLALHLAALSCLRS